MPSNYGRKHEIQKIWIPIVIWIGRGMVPEGLLFQSHSITQDKNKTKLRHDMVKSGVQK